MMTGGILRHGLREVKWKGEGKGKDRTGEGSLFTSPRLTGDATLGGRHVAGTRTFRGILAIKIDRLSLAELVVAVIRHSASVEEELLARF